MPQDLQLPVLSPFIQLAQANMLLLTSMWSPRPLAAMSTPAALDNPLSFSLLLVQGMSKNYVEFLTALGRDGSALFAAGRGGLVTLVREL